MAGLNETPRGNRVHVAFFGLRNAGKSTLVNAFTGQHLAIVSDVAGTTTDPVSKAMEILPLGPCLVTDTAGLDDDQGDLGAQRVEKTLAVLATADVAVWVASPGDESYHARFLARCRASGTVTLDYRRGDDVEDLKRRIAAAKGVETPPPLLDGLVAPGDVVVCVCPIDGSAPKNRLILPQQQTIREALDARASALVCQCAELAANLRRLDDAASPLVVTDSQAFAEVSATLAAFPRARLTSFSILFARQKGDLAAYVEGAAALKSLRDGDSVLIAEGCTHRRQCNDIGTVKLPRAIERFTGRKLRFEFTSGGDFPTTFADRAPALVVQCGGCMLTRREVRRRIETCRASGVAITNYGVCLAACRGIAADAATCLIAR